MTLLDDTLKRRRSREEVHFNEHFAASFSILLPVSYHSIRQVGQFSVQPNPQQSVFAGHEQLQQSNSK